MKYNAKKLNNSNSFAVFSGKKYFTNTVTTNEKQAKEQALIMSMQFYQEQMDNAFSELCKLSGTDQYGVVKLQGQDYTTSKCDLMC
jgi:hypothetical protein